MLLLQGSKVHRRVLWLQHLAQCGSTVWTSPLSVTTTGTQPAMRWPGRSQYSTPSSCCSRRNMRNSYSTMRNSLLRESSVATRSSPYESNGEYYIWLCLQYFSNIYHIQVSVSLSAARKTKKREGSKEDKRDWSPLNLQWRNQNVWQ